MYSFKVKLWTHMPRFFKFEERACEHARRDDYYKVFMFDTFEEMYDYVDKIEGEKLERNYAGRTLCFKRVRYGENLEIVDYSPYCGNIYLCDEAYTFNAVSHECAHAIIGYFNRRIQDYANIFDKGIENDYIEEISRKDDQEELFCYMLGLLMSKIVEKIDEKYKSVKKV